MTVNKKKLYITETEILISSFLNNNRLLRCIKDNQRMMGVPGLLISYSGNRMSYATYQLVLSCKDVNRA